MRIGWSRSAIGIGPSSPRLPTRRARTHAFGTPDSPSNYDIDALDELVEKYSLIGKLTTTWNGTL